MTLDKVRTAEAEARRFLERAKAWRAAQGTPHGCTSTPKESGALRRASLDLTRALAEMRRPA